MFLALLIFEKIQMKTQATKILNFILKESIRLCYVNHVYIIRCTKSVLLNNNFLICVAKIVKCIFVYQCDENSCRLLR